MEDVPQSTTAQRARLLQSHAPQAHIIRILDKAPAQHAQVVNIAIPLALINQLVYVERLISAMQDHQTLRVTFAILKLKVIVQMVQWLSHSAKTVNISREMVHAQNAQQARNVPMD